MNIASHMLGTSREDGLKVGVGSPLLALLPALVSLVVPAPAWGDVYRWTDANGKTFYSDVLPKPGEKVKNFEVVAKEVRRESKAPAQLPKPTEQELLERIQALERQLQTQRYLASIPVYPPQAPSASYYPPAPPPPAVSYYDSGYYGSGYPVSYYPAYYTAYSYPVVRAYAPVVYPARTYVSRPVPVASHGGSFHAGGGHVAGGFRGGGHNGGGHRGRR